MRKYARPIVVRRLRRIQVSNVWPSSRRGAGCRPRLVERDRRRQLREAGEALARSASANGSTFGIAPRCDPMRVCLPPSRMTSWPSLYVGNVSSPSSSTSSYMRFWVGPIHCPPSSIGVPSAVGPPRSGRRPGRAPRAPSRRAPPATSRRAAASPQPGADDDHPFGHPTRSRGLATPCSGRAHLSALETLQQAPQQLNTGDVRHDDTARLGESGRRVEAVPQTPQPAGRRSGRSAPMRSASHRLQASAAANASRSTAGRPATSPRCGRGRPEPGEEAAVVPQREAVEPLVAPPGDVSSSRFVASVGGPSGLVDPDRLEERRARCRRPGRPVERSAPRSATHDAVVCVEVTRPPACAHGARARR